MKEIKLLEDQIEKLNAKGFDLDAWKQYTVVLLSRIFGQTDTRIGQIEKLEYDYSSWSLRDTTGTSEYLDTCKKLGREILQASIDELKTFGLPDKKMAEKGILEAPLIRQALEEELKISQMRALLEIINSNHTRNEKKELLRKLLKELGPDFSESTLISVLSDPGLAGKL